jgi:hypothetical protein
MPQSERKTEHVELTVSRSRCPPEGTELAIQVKEASALRERRDGIGDSADRDLEDQVHECRQSRRVDGLDDDDRDGHDGGRAECRPEGV